MPRYIKANVTKEELIEKIIEEATKYADEDDLELSKELYEDNPIEGIESYLGDIIYNNGVPKDLEKIDFDFENLFLTYEEYIGLEPFDTVHGSNIIWVYAGGDWECPVIFIIYIDDNDKLRFYIPNKGNTYCHKCKKAYGSCECEDAEDIGDIDDIKPDIEAMREDVRNRLQIKGE